MNIGKYPWYLLPVHVVAPALVIFCIELPLVIIGLPLCAIGVSLVPREKWHSTKDLPNLFPRVLWLWDSYVSTVPEAWWWEKDKWTKKLGEWFHFWWWRAVRNAVNNFSRSFINTPDLEDLVVLTGSTEGAAMRPWMSGDQYFNIKEGFRYRVVWNREKVWQAWFHFVWMLPLKNGRYKYWNVMYGFRLGNTRPGLGWTLRVGLKDTDRGA